MQLHVRDSVCFVHISVRVFAHMRVHAQRSWFCVSQPFKREYLLMEFGRCVVKHFLPAVTYSERFKRRTSDVKERRN